MDINDLAFVKSSLSAMRPADWLNVSEQSKVPLGTLRKIAYGEVSDPRFWTIKKLADHFRSLQSAPNLTPGRRRASDRKDRTK